jgi:uncharacterized phage infection (PIP) family protein YhgE
VTAVLQDDYGNYHRGFKRFGSETAQLAFSKDGIDWTPNGKNRQVDENLRELLNWGLPGRGGKSRIQGLPDTYLVSALLAPQEQPGKIFGAQLNDDYTDDGKQLLSDALQALAEDPEFKRLMERTHAKVCEVFTETGRERGVSDSPFVRVAAEIKAITKQCTELREKAEKCRYWRTERDSIRESLPAAESAMAEAEAKLTELESGDHVRQDLLKILAAATTDRDAARAAHESVQKAETARAAHAKVVDQQKTQHSQVHAREATAREQLAAAQTALEQLNSDQQTAKRQLAAADARRAIDAHRIALGALTRTQDKVSAAAKLAATIRAARDNQERNASERQRHDGLQKTQESQLAAAQKSLVDCRRMLTWHEQAAAEKRLAQLRTESTQRGAREARLAEFAKELAAKQRDPLLREAPDADSIAKLRKLDHELSIAKEGLDVGLSVELTPIIPFSGRMRVDGQTGEATRFEGKQALDAQRDVVIEIDNLANIVVRAGAPGARERFDLLSTRWQNEAAPVLAKAKVKTIDALNAVQQRATTLHSDIAGLQRSIDTAQDELAALNDPSEQLADAEAHRDTLLRESNDALPSERTRAQVEADQRSAEAAIATLQQDLGATRSELARLQAGSDRDAADVAKSQTALADLEAELGASWQAVRERTESEIEALNAKIANGEKSLTALESGGGSDVSAAKPAVSAAEQAVEDASAATAEAQTALEQAQARLGELERDCEFRKDQAAAKDLTACEAAVHSTQAKLDALGQAGADAVAAQQVAVTQQRRIIEEKTHKIAGLEAQLGEYGSDIVHEQLKIREEALALKENEEKRIRADYAAWQKLEETLIEVHQEQSAHLGNRVAGGVIEHFRELTGSRFERLLLGPNLEFEGLRAGGGKRQLSELSVGAQEQLAAVLRLALARHLGMMVMLDDHLVHSDATRLDWLRDRLRSAAEQSQIIIWTCHPGHYLTPDELASPKEPIRDSGDVRAIDLSTLINPNFN